MTISTAGAVSSSSRGERATSVDLEVRFHLVYNWQEYMYTLTKTTPQYNSFITSGLWD